MGRRWSKSITHKPKEIKRIRSSNDLSMWFFSTIADHSQVYYENEIIREINPQSR